MTIRRFALLMLLILIAPVLAACGGDDGDGGDGGDASSQSASLSQTYDEAGLTFSYPEGWVATSESDGALVANNQEVLDMASSGQEGEIPEGGQAATVMGFPVPADSGIEPSAFVELMASEAEEGTEMGEAEDVTIGDASGIKVTVTDAASNGEGAIYVLRLNDEVLIAVIGLARQGSYDDALVQSIAGTVSYAPPSDD